MATPEAPVHARTGHRGRPVVVIGLLGTTLDRGAGARRWNRWRPTVSVCAQPDLLVDRFVLLHQPRFAALADQVVADIGALSPETTVVLRPIEMADPWDFESVYDELADIARDFPFDPEAEDYLVHITTGSHVAQICLFLLTESRQLPARLLQTGPSREHGIHGRHAIIDLDLSRYDRLAVRHAAEQLEARHVLKDGIETLNAAYNRLIERIELVALRSREPMLVLGPTGAGKSHLARRIYDLKHQRRQVSGAFVELNCATLRGDAAMAALFGHVRGAYTGAVKDRPGLLRAGDKGVVFLDEIGELGLDEQAMLLRALEERRFLPVGSDREVRSDFQLIAGTNRDLVDDAAAGRFREDLLARIDTWTFRLPGLAERREDIAPNLDYELERVARDEGRRVRFNREARARYLAFAHDPASTWSRNFRDLGASVRRMSTLAEGGRITEDLVEEELRRLRRAWRGSRARDRPWERILDEVLDEESRDGLDHFDAVQLAEVIRVCRAQPSISAAGRALFAESRKRRKSVNDADRLRKYLARFELTFETVQPPRPGR